MTTKESNTEYKMDMAYSVHLGPAKIGVDLGDGSERADYVNQDYIIGQLGRPHRCVNIMYTYYPNDEQWPARISEACADMNVTFAWDYPYDDYFPYGADGQPFEQMKDIRRHGQDVMLTLTMDTKVTDEQIVTIAKELKPFGRMRLRINHECNGNWFTHNKRNSYKEIGQFFTRAYSIIKQEAPNIEIVFCAGVIEDDKAGVPYQQEFTEAYKKADIYSCDKYLALHYGWPYDVAEKGGGQYASDSVDHVYGMFKRTSAHLNKLFGKKKFILGEFNTDGDVTGGFEQPDSIKRFYEKAACELEGFLDGISMYQFRDKGRLGLEIQDPNNASVGIRQPLFDTYKEIINSEVFLPELKANNSELMTFPARLRWGGSEDSDGIALPINLKDIPVFFEVTFDEEVSLMIECLGRWFYKASGVKTIDMMSIFYEAKREGKLEELSKEIGSAVLNIFVTPKDGVNPKTGDADEYINYYDIINTCPEIRIRYEACDHVG